MAGVLYELYVKLGLDTKDYDKQIQDAKKEGSTFGDVLKGSLASAAIQKGISTLTSGIKTAAGAFKNITVAAVNSYKDYEQLTGGVETLFKTSSGKVQKYAEEAYKTSGMSANQYMETVTGFSASLISSLDGDTAKAAEYADRAIRDMSDNANKMGTDISSIQTAYQGFAKQNYTMLDNLKLGYGGTKEEAQRLIQEASKMNKAMKEVGVTVDANDLSFGNLVNAISVVQKNMDITGTTAKEAMTTIEGSANATKAAWQNVLSAIAGGGDLKKAMAQLQEAVFGGKKGEGLLNQIIPRVKQVFEGIADFVAQAAPIIKEKLPKLIDDLKPVLQTMMKSISDIIRTLIPLLVPVFLEIGGALVSGIVKGLGDLGPVGKTIQNAMAFLVAAKFVTGATSLIKGISGISSALITLSSKAIPVVIQGMQALLPLLGNPTVMIIAALVAAIVAAVVVIVKNWDSIKKAAQDLWKNVQKTFDSFKKGVGQVFSDIGKNIKNNWNEMTKAVADKASSLKEAVKTKYNEMKMNIQTTVREISNNVRQTFEDIKNKIGETVTNIATGAKEKWEALKATAQDLWSKIGDVMKTPVNAAKGAIEAAINGVKGVFSGLQQFATGIGNAMKRIGDAIVAPIKAAYQVINSIMSGIRTVYNGIKNTATNIGNTLSNAVGTLTGTSTVRHADAMGEGIIFDRLTTFGYANGKIHQAGEAGQEALIGTKSLSNIIKNAVRNGMSGTGGGVTINVYGAQGQNINDLADAVADRFQVLVDRKAAVWA